MAFTLSSCDDYIDTRWRLWQVYEEYAEQADLWLAGKEAFLANEDPGVSVSRNIATPNNLTTNKFYTQWYIYLFPEKLHLLKLHFWCN